MSLTQINKAGLDEIALDHVFTIGASGTSAYTFQGEGLNGTVNNPTLYLTRGKTYRFENGTGAHPIRIQSTSGASGTAYNTGVTNNAGSGTVIVEVQHYAPDVLYYQCTSHAAMNGILYITGALADGGVTTAKIAADAVDGTKIADNAVNSEHYTDGSIDREHLAADIVDGTKIADDAIDSEHYTNASIDAVHIANNTITASQIANDAVGTGELASNAVTTAKIADEAVTLAKLEHGTSSNDGKFLRANNGADPTFETVSGTTINNNANNKVITGSDTANTLEGEANLTYDGSKLQINDSSISQLVQSYGNNNRVKTLAGSNFLQMITQNDVSLQFRYATDTGSGSEVARVNANGISFSGSNAASESLHDYEEGTWTPANGSFTTFNVTSSQINARYTKIGDQVTVWINQEGGQIAWSQPQYLTGLPFTVSVPSAGTFTNNYPNAGGEALIWAGERIYMAQSDGYNTNNYKMVFCATYRTTA